MSAYTKKVFNWQRYYSEITEDVLAASACLPFTIALYWWNAIAPKAVWNIGRHLLLTPLYIGKGFITPFIFLLSLSRALHQDKTERYSFSIGKGLERLGGYNPRKPLRFISRLAFLAVTFSIIMSLWAGSFPVWASFLLTGLSSLTVGLSIRGALFLAVSGIALLEGITQKFTATLREKIHQRKIAGQLQTLRQGQNTFENNEEIDLTEIGDIPPENIFVSNSNHVFDLTNLQANAEQRGLQNYYLARPDNQVFLDKEDILRLEAHPNLAAFPRLRDFLAANRQEYLQRRSRLISEESLVKLEELVFAIDADRDNGNQEARGIRENIVQANEAFLRHLEQVTPEERQAVENMRVEHGYNSLRHLLDTVFAGDECVKVAARMIRSKIAHVRVVGDEDSQALFWQRQKQTAGL